MILCHNGMERESPSRAVPPHRTKQMKKTLITLALGALAGTAMAGTPVSAPVTPASAPDSLFGPGWVASPYALFMTPDSDKVDDVWGGGIDCEYFFNSYVSLGIQGQWADVDGDLGQIYTAISTLRYPVTSNIAPYIQGAIGYGDLAGSGDLLGSAAVGLDVRINEAWGMFADWTYAFPGGGGGEDDFEDYQLIRAGFRINF